MNIKGYFLLPNYGFTPAARVLLAALLTTVLTCPYALAQISQEQLQSAWDRARLYEADSGPVRSFALSGRLQWEAAWFDADEGDFDDTLWRRFRFGLRSELPRGWLVHLEGDFDLNESRSDWYNRLTDAYLGWSPQDSDLQVKVLKQSAGFTLDGATSSKKLYTLQRNNLTNNLWFTAEYFTGLSIAGDSGGPWSYKVGLFSSDGDDEVAATRASYFTLTSFSYDLSSTAEVDRGVLRLDYVYNDKDEEANTRDFSHVLSLSSQWQRDNWHLSTDLAWGDGHLGQEDLWGIVVMPFYDLGKHWQAVLRYTYLDSDGGVRLGRYEREITRGRGDNYHEFYAGMNLFLFGHRAKWQTGIQYASMDSSDPGESEYDGWGITSGLRLYW